MFKVEIYIFTGQRSRNKLCLPSEGREATYCNDHKGTVALTDLCVSVLAVPLTGSVFLLLQTLVIKSRKWRSQQSLPYWPTEKVKWNCACKDFCTVPGRS